MQKLKRKLLVVTAPLPNAGGQQSICKSGRFAGTIIFALQMATNIVSLSVIFR
jgi:hypothetical protein